MCCGASTDIILLRGRESFLSIPSVRSDVIERIAALHRLAIPMDVVGRVVFFLSSSQRPLSRVETYFSSTACGLAR